MTSGAGPLTQGTAWNALREHYEAIKTVHMRDLFAKDPGRGARLVCDAQGIYLDYSKNRLTDDTMRLLLDLANAAGLRVGYRRDVSRRQAQCDGESRSPPRRAARARRRYH